MTKDNITFNIIETDPTKSFDFRAPPPPPSSPIDSTLISDLPDLSWGIPLESNVITVPVMVLGEKVNRYKHSNEYGLRDTATKSIRHIIIPSSLIPVEVNKPKKVNVNVNKKSRIIITDLF